VNDYQGKAKVERESKRENEGRSVRGRRRGGGAARKEGKERRE
jgi:hypothetical protein